MRNGSFIKAVGGDFGLVWHEGKWERFDCIGCLYAQGIAIPSLRIQGRSLPQGFEKLPVIHRHDIQTHAKWLREGKPV